MSLRCTEFYSRKGLFYRNFLKLCFVQHWALITPAGKDKQEETLSMLVLGWGMAQVIECLPSKKKKQNVVLLTYCSKGVCTANERGGILVRALGRGFLWDLC
jgi:hypothetical protein